MKEYLHIFINHKQDDLADQLPMVEFATSNNNFIFTKLFTLFVSKILYLHISFDVINILDETTPKGIDKKKAINISEVR